MRRDDGAAPATTRGIRVSLRTKVLGVIAALLLATMGTYLYLATSLFRRDKLAYVYDLNAAQVETLAEQTRGHLEFLAEKARWYAAEVERAGSNADAIAAAARMLFARETDLLRVRIVERAPDGRALVARQSFRNDGVLARAGLAAERLDALDREAPLPLEALAAPGAGPFVQNSSLPPDAGILTLAVPCSTPAGSGAVVVDFRHERLLRLFTRTAVQTAYLVSDRGQVLAHPDAARVVGRAALADHPLVRTALESRVERGVKEFRAPDGSARLGAYGRVGVAGLQVLVEVSRDEALRAGRELVRRSAYFGLAIVLAAFLVSVFFARLLTAPLRRLRDAAQAVGQGRFEADAAIRSSDEIGELGRAFAEMGRALRQTQAQLVQSEKLAAFGQLGAGITHEVKNPVTGIVSLAQVAQRRLDQPEKMREVLELIEKEGLRCRDILVNFLRFARADSQGFARLDPNRVVEDVGRLIRHQLGTGSVKLHLELGADLPAVMGNPAGLSQVLLNLALNAQQAMPAGGQVWLRTVRGADGGVVIAVQDSGPGIPPDIQRRLFEPFFTTKASGEGTGLGLSVSHTIVHDHGGTLTVESEVGKGATFSVRLPAAGPPGSPPTTPPAAAAG